MGVVTSCCCLFVCFKCLICHSQLAAMTTVLSQFLKVLPPAPPPPPPTRGLFSAACSLSLFSVIVLFFVLSVQAFFFFFFSFFLSVLLFYYYFFSHFTPVAKRRHVASGEYQSLSFSDTVATQVRDSSLLSVTMLPALFILQRHY